MFKNKTLNKILQTYYNCINFRNVCWYCHSIKETFVMNFALITTVNQELFSKSFSSLLLSPTSPGRPSGEFLISFSAMSHLVLSVYSSPGSPHLHFCPSLAAFFKSGFWYFPSLRNCDFLPCDNLPPDPTSLPILIQDYTWICFQNSSEQQHNLFPLPVFKLWAENEKDKNKQLKCVCGGS